MLAAIHSAHVRGCFTSFLTQIFKGERVKGATAGPVTIQSGTPPAPGMSGSFGWRVTATFEVRGVKVPIYLDFLGFVHGPSEVTLLSSGLLRPFPAEVQQHLFTLLLTRARTHGAVSDPTWSAVDGFVEEHLLADDAGLEAAVQASVAAGLPPIAVTPSQGKLLHLIARAIGVRSILEIGTLGGYSSIWLARALPASGAW